MSTIEIPVSDDIVQRFAQTAPEQKRKLCLLLGLRLQELVDPPQRTWQQAMDEIGRAAAARGLTPAKLEELLRGV